MNVWTTEAPAGATTRHGPELAVGGHPLGLSDRPRSPAFGGRPVLAGIRPESLTIAAGGLPAVVEVVESLGHERIVTCSLADGQEAVVRVDTRQGPIQRGQHLELAIDPTELALFDAETGDRLP